MTGGETLHTALAARRNGLGLSMRQVADRIGCSVSSVHDWEHGKKAPLVSHAQAWAEALGYTLTLAAHPVSRAVDLETLIHDTLFNLICDHPMWIDDNQTPLDYSPERESRIGDFLHDATRALIASMGWKPPRPPQTPQETA